MVIKEGTYIKVWNGNEDNVVMVDLLEKMDDVSFDDLYNKLKEEYNKINSDFKLIIA